MNNNEICIPAIKLTKERLLEGRKIIDEKIKALDIVLEMFDDPEKAAIEKIITHKDALSEEEKKDQKKNKPYRSTFDEPIGTFKDRKFIKGKKLA